MTISLAQSSENIVSGSGDDDVSFSAGPTEGNTMVLLAAARPEDFSGSAPTIAVTTGSGTSGTAWDLADDGTDTSTATTSNHRLSIFLRDAGASEGTTHNVNPSHTDTTFQTQGHLLEFESDAGETLDWANAEVVTGDSGGSSVSSFSLSTGTLPASSCLVVAWMSIRQSAIARQLDWDTTNGIANDPFGEQESTNYLCRSGWEVVTSSDTFEVDCTEQGTGTPVSAQACGVLVIIPITTGGGTASGSLAETQDDQTSTASGAFVTNPTGSAATVTEDDDTSAASATFTPPVYAATLAEIEDDDTSTASATFTAPVYTGSLAETEDDDTSTGSGTYAGQNPTGSAAVTEENDTSTAAGTLVTNPTGSTNRSFSDDFNRASLGADWEAGSAWEIGTNDLTVTPVSADDYVALLSEGQGTGFQQAIVTVKAGLDAWSTGIVLRATPQATGYRVLGYLGSFNESSSFAIYRLTQFGRSLIGSGGTAGTYPQTIRFTADGSSLTLDYWNGSGWTNAVSVTDSTRNGQRVGLAHTDTGTTGTFDDFSVLTRGTVAGDDTSAGVGNQVDPNPAGSLAETQDDQTSAASGTFVPNPIGSLAETQDGQTSAGSAAFTAPVYTGSLAETEDDDTASASAAFTVPVYTGSLAEAEENDTLAGAGSYTSDNPTGSLAETQDDQTSAATGTFTPPVYTSSLAEAQDDQTSAATGTFSLPNPTGSLAETQDDQTSSAAGAYAPPNPTGSLAVTEADDVSTAAGLFVQLLGVAAIQAESDVLVGVGAFASPAGAPEPVTGIRIRPWGVRPRFRVLTFFETDRE